MTYLRNHFEKRFFRVGKKSKSKISNESTKYIAKKEKMRKTILILIVIEWWTSYLLLKGHPFHGVQINP